MFSPYRQNVFPFVRMLLTHVYLQNVPKVCTNSNVPDNGCVSYSIGTGCSICYEDGTEDTPIGDDTPPALCILPCSHTFHSHCLNQMALHTPPKQTDIGRCPYCMVPLKIESVAVLQSDKVVTLCSLWLTSSQSTLM